MLDIIVIFDSLRKDVADSFFKEKLKNIPHITLDNCYTHSGWTPFAISHILSGELPSIDKAMSFNATSPGPIIWRKKRKVDTNQLKTNLLNRYDSRQFILFEWSSLQMLHSFYSINKTNTEKISINREIGKNGEITFDWEKAIDTAKYAVQNSTHNPKNRNILFIRTMGTHAPYMANQGVAKKIGLLNKKIGVFSKKINSKLRNNIHKIYKTLIYEQSIEKDINEMLSQQKGGLENDWNKLIDKILQYLKGKSIDYNLILMADHGDIFSKYFHLQGHAHYFTKEVAQIPVYILSSKLTKQITAKNLVYSSDILNYLLKSSENINIWKQDTPKKKFEFHCKDDFLFSAKTPNENRFKIESKRKSINSYITIKGLNLIESDIPKDKLWYLNNRYIIDKIDTHRISTLTYAKDLNKLINNSPYAKDFTTHYKSKTS